MAASQTPAQTTKHSLRFRSFLGLAWGASQTRSDFAHVNDICLSSYSVRASRAHIDPPTMPAKRQRPESFSPPPPAVYVLVDGVSESSDPNAESTSPKQNDQLPLEENHLATATTRDADNDNIRQGSPEHDPAGDGIIYIDCSDEEERAVNGNVPEPPAGAAGDNSLLGLHQGLVAQSA